MEKINYILDTVEKVYQSFGFKEVDTPVMEYTDLFQRSIGDFTDIVQKEMFTFLDRKNRSITLRPEGTAGIIRAYIDNNLAFEPGLSKLFSYGPMFRAERPQKGRLREFHQFGCEAIGTQNPLIDAEVIEIHTTILKKLNIKDIILEINSVGCRDCRKEYIKKLQAFLMTIKDALCKNCSIRAEKNPLRVFDCKIESCQEHFTEAPLLTDNLCDDCLNHFTKLQSYLKTKKVEFQINKRLVRGFDYYTKTVFEVKSGSIGSQNALLGGGRYDYLIETLGGKPAPAVGAAAGMERLIIAMEEQKAFPEQEQYKKENIYLAIAGDIDMDITLKLTETLRNNNYKCFYTYETKSLKSQLKEAGKLQCGYCLILGEEELKNNQIVIKDFNKGDQISVNINDFINNPINDLK